MKHSIERVILPTAEAVALRVDFEVTGLNLRELYERADEYLRSLQPGVDPLFWALRFSVSVESLLRGPDGPVMPLLWKADVEAIRR